MKGLRSILCPTVLLAVWACLCPSLMGQEQVKSGELGSPPIQPPIECQDHVAQLREVVESAPERLNELLGRAILQSKHCTCELLTAAIVLSDGSDAAVKQIVRVALQHAGEMSSAIAECAVIAAPTRIEAIQLAFEEHAGAKKKAAPKKLQPVQGKMGSLIKKIVPSWKREEKPGEDLVVVEKKNKEEKWKPAEMQVASDKPRGDMLVSESEPLEPKTRSLRAVDQGWFDFLLPVSMGELGQLPRDESLPLRWSIYGESGFDSNVNTASSSEAVDSYFVGAGVVSYFDRVSQSGKVDVMARFGARYNEAGPVSLENMVYRGRLVANVERQVASRLTLSNQMSISYDVEPDWLSGETTGLRTDQYVFAYNRLAFGYRWGKHFATRSFYRISTIQYQGAGLSFQEDRWRHLLGQQFRFLSNERLALFAEYRYGQTQFDRAANDSQSHYFLLGADYEVSSKWKGSLLAGAERRSFERYADQWKAYGEASLQAKLSAHTSVRWVARLGFEDAELAGFRDRYSFRTGLAADQQLSDRLDLSLGVFYLHSEFSAPESGLLDYQDEAVMIQASLTYALSEYFDLYLTYELTRYDSEDVGKDYQRQQVRVGVNTRF
ncbi:MAG: outer membrane beta-barrel protein [Verrucomicrobiales bacterium]|nr:outer membrane beta-barrel protein [Verrucomicrobiales bacterium]